MKELVSSATISRLLPNTIQKDSQWRIVRKTFSSIDSARYPYKFLIQKRIDILGFKFWITKDYEFTLDSAKATLQRKKQESKANLERRTEVVYEE